MSGLRFVKPYEVTYHHKVANNSELIGKTILQIYEEYCFLDPQIIVQALKSGEILVNEKQIKPNFIVKQNDIISHSFTKYEPPVCLQFEK